MIGLKRPAAVLGFSLLFSLVILMSSGLQAAYFCLPALLILSAFFLLRRSNTGCYLLAVTACFIAAALLLTAANRFRYEPSKRFLGRGAVLTGTVTDFPQKHPASQSVELKNCVFDGEKTAYTVKIYYTDGSFPRPGDEVTVTVSEIFSDAKESSGFFYHTLSGGTWLSAFSRSALTVEECKIQPFYARLAELRCKVRSKAAAYMSEDLSAVCTAVLTGDQSDIPDEIRTDFRKSGVSHIFAVSGMHLAVWTGLLFTLLRKRARIRLIPNLVTILFIWLYVAFTGFSPSVLRAGIMLTLICAGSVLRKHSDPVNALGVASLILLIVNPWLAGNVSFLLSFTATFAIVGVFPLLSERPIYSKRIVRNQLLTAKEGILLSVLVLFVTIPCSAYFFGYAPILTPLTSLICTPLAELMMIFSAFGSLLPSGFFFTRWIYTVSASLANAIVLVTNKAASLEFAIFPLREGYIPVAFVVCAAVFIFLRFYRKSSRTMICNTMLALCCAALLAGIVFTGMTANDYTLFIPEAGNATIISVVSGTGARSMLLGSGGDYNAFRDTREFLQSRTAFTPDYVFIPRKGKAQTEQLSNIIKQLPPDHLILASDAEPIRGMPEDTVICDDFSGEIWKDVRIRYNDSPDFCAGILKINGTKIVFCLYPVSDFTEADEEFLYGDHLICRGSIPDTLDATRFSSVIVLSDKDAQTLGLPANAVSTADTGAVSLTFRRQHFPKGGSRYGAS